jgi:hypothetical protein
MTRAATKRKALKAAHGIAQPIVFRRERLIPPMDYRHKPTRRVSVARRWRVNFGRRLTTHNDVRTLNWSAGAV